MIDRFDKFTQIGEINDLRSYIEDEFPNLELSGVGTLVTRKYSRAITHAQTVVGEFSILFKSGEGKTEVLIRIYQILDMFSKTMNLEINSIILWDRCGKTSNGYDMSSIKKFKEMIESGEFTDPSKIQISFGKSLRWLDDRFRSIAIAPRNNPPHF